VIHSKYSGRTVSLLVALPLILSAQSARDTVAPLKNWDTPLYWHPNSTERSAGAKPVPQQLPNALSPDALIFVAMTPCRLVDTRGATRGFDGIAPFSGLPGPLPGSQTVTFPVLTNNQNTMPAPCGAISPIAEAYSLNVTVIPVTTLGSVYVTVWPTADGPNTPPSVSTVNDPQGTVVANSLIVAGGTPNGAISLFNYGPGAVNVIIDMNGYFAAPTDESANTGIGAGTLANLAGGYNNLAIGADALREDTTGNFNTASGTYAMTANTTGLDNTASGAYALNSNVGGGYNTVSGAFALLDNTSGANNTAAGYQALAHNVSGGNNTALGYQALQYNGVSNITAVGYQALENNSTGTDNTATGYLALMSNSFGTDNTANGYSALQNATGSFNTAIGSLALQANANGQFNTATGYNALASNLGGTDNTANGFQALNLNLAGTDNTATGYNSLQNTTGSFNTATGSRALGSNTAGSSNTAVGFSALSGNLGGLDNTAIGTSALSSITAGNFNIAIGDGAEESLSFGDNNINIGGQGGLPGDSGVIRLGYQGTQTATFIAGIYGAPDAGGLEVFVNANGQLSTATSSGRFKEQITDMGDSSNKLLQLRPVNFYYKPGFDDGSHLLQYGLIAEEVAKVYPEMVAYANDGKVLSVKYQLLAPMLLNELQKQAAQNRRQAEDIRSQADSIRSQAQEIRQQVTLNRSLEDRIAALEAGVATRSPSGPQPVK
jgi:trimeric autotransporter adhesin